MRFPKVMCDGTGDNIFFIWPKDHIYSGRLIIRTFIGKVKSSLNLDFLTSRPREKDFSLRYRQFILSGVHIKEVLVRTRTSLVLSSVYCGSSEGIHLEFKLSWRGISFDLLLLPGLFYLFYLRIAKTIIN